MLEKITSAEPGNINTFMLFYYTVYYVVVLFTVFCTGLDKASLPTGTSITHR